MSESDIESVISEEMAYGSDNGSEEYDPTAYQDDDFEDSYAVEPPKIVASKPLAPPPPPPPAVKPTVVPPPKQTSAASTKPFNALKVREDSVEYSAVFDDDFEQESVEADKTNYSNDFEEDSSDVYLVPPRHGSIPGGIGHSKQAIPISSNSKASTGNMPIVPTLPAAGPAIAGLPALLNIEAMQAELAIDEISKEVLRLRSRQKALLRERKNLAKEKKLRAEQRRHQYQEEMKNMNDRAIAAEQTVSSLTAQIEVLKSRIQCSEDMCAEKQRNLDIERHANIALRENLLGVELTVKDREKEIEALKVAAQQALEHFGEKADEIKSQLQRAELMVSVLERSSEANEERIRRERDNLPEHHQRVVNEQMDRLRLQEMELQERDGISRAEQTRKLAAIDSLRAETLTDLDRMRQRMESEIVLLREDLAARSLQLERDKAEFLSWKASEISMIDVKNADILRQQKSLEAMRATILRERSELEVRQKLLEPNLAAADRDREDARALKAKAEMELTRAEEKLSAVLEADRNLVLRERALMEGLHTLQQSKTEVLQNQQRAEAMEAAAMNIAQTVQNERFQLHIAAVEMSEQISIIRKAMKLLVEKGWPISTIARIEDNKIEDRYLLEQKENSLVERLSPPQLSSRQPSNSDEKSVHKVAMHLDPTIQRVMMTLDRASQSLSEQAEVLRIEGSSMKVQQKLQFMTATEVGNTNAVIKASVHSTQSPKDVHPLPSSRGSSTLTYTSPPTPPLLRPNIDPHEINSRSTRFGIRNHGTKSILPLDDYTIETNMASIDLAGIELQRSLEDTQSLTSALKLAAKMFV